MYFRTTVLNSDGMTSTLIDMPINRFSYMNKLSQYYSVDQFSRIVDMRLLAIKRNGPRWFCFGSKGDNFLPDSFNDSRRALQTKARNVLELVSAMGRPHTFITLTTNTEWREIKEAIPAGDSAYRHPEIVARVFKLKLQKFLKNLHDGKYFHGEKIKYRVSTNKGVCLMPTLSLRTKICLNGVTNMLYNDGSTQKMASVQHALCRPMRIQVQITFDITDWLPSL